MVLSALFFPGAGQFVQGRTMAGTLYLGAFLVAFVLFAVAAGRIIAAYYSLLSNVPGREPSLPLVQMIAWFGAAFLVYIANVVDVCIVHFRRKE